MNKFLFLLYSKKIGIMDELLEWMEYIEDSGQHKRIKHKLKDILVIVLFATLANADD